jgi:hypothetical protein
MDYTTFSNNIAKTPNQIEKLELSYNHSDGRCWTAIINPKTQNILVTYIVNRYEIGYQGFDIMTTDVILSDIAVEDIYDVLETLTLTNPITVDSE